MVLQSDSNSKVGRVFNSMLVHLVLVNFVASYPFHLNLDPFDLWTNLQNMNCYCFRSQVKLNFELGLTSR